MSNLITLAMLSFLAATLATTASGQPYPNKPIRIFTSDAGGGADVSARIIAQGVSGPLGQQVIVENRGGGVIAGDIVAHAAPDGYTLLYYGNSLWLLPFMRSSVPYNAATDFVPITLSTSSPSLLVVHPSLPVKSTKELIALAKSKPGAINYGSASSGTANHLAAELFNSMANVKITRVPYKGNGQALTATVAGEVQLMFPAAGSVGPHLKTGRLRAVAVTGTTRAVAFPDIPTIAESALPGYESLSLIALFAPAKTPEAIVSRLNREVAAVLHRPDVKERFLSMGVDAVGSTPAQLAQKIESEVQRMGKVIKNAGIGDN